MESGERLPSPPVPSAPLLSGLAPAPALAPAASTSTTSSSTSSTPAPATSDPSPIPTSKSSLPTSPATLGPSLTTCGHVFRTGSEQPFSVSSAFPMVSHPAFGLHTTSAGRSEFGGLGSLGMSAALAAHPQLASFPEWWRASDVHGRAAAAAAFFPPLLGLPPLFTPPVQSPDPSGPFQSRTPTKNGRPPTKGLNGTLSGNGSLPGSEGGLSVIPSPALGATEPPKAPTSVPRSRKNKQEVGRITEKLLQKAKEKKLRKKALEISSNSDSESGSSSDSSSDGVSSSDLDDLEDDEDEDEDDDDQSNDSEDSDLEKRRRGNRKGKTSTDIQKASLPHTLQDRLHEDHRGAVQTHKPLSDEGLLSGRYPPGLPLPLHLPLSLSQPPPLLFSGSRPKEENSTQHRSVIQATGMAASAKPLSLVTQKGRDSSPVSLVTSSPKPRSHSSSPRPLGPTSSSSLSPRPPSVSSSSPKPLSLCSSPRPPSLSSSPKPPTLSPSHKPKSTASTPASAPAPAISPKPLGLPDGLKGTSRSFLDETLLQINNFKLKQPFLSQEHLKQVFPTHHKSTLDSTLAALTQRNQKMSSATTPFSTSSTTPLPFPSLSCVDTMSSAAQRLLSSFSGHPNLFLASTLLGQPCSPQPQAQPQSQPNGVIQSAMAAAAAAATVQEAPLALITKPRGPSRTAPDRPLLAATSPPFSTPVNLTTGARQHSLASATTTTSSATPYPISSATSIMTSGVNKSSPRSRKGKPSKVTTAAPSATAVAAAMAAAAAGMRSYGSGPGQQSHLVQSLVDLFRNTESDIPSSKDSNDSMEEEDWEEEEDDDEDDDDSDDSQSDSESNLSDTDASEGLKERSGTTTDDTEAERTPLKLAKAAAMLRAAATTGLSSSTNMTPLNLHLPRTPSSSALTHMHPHAHPLLTSAAAATALAYHSTPSSSSSSFVFSPPSGSGGRRKRVTDERELRVPLDLGWKREVRIRNVAGRLQGDVAYYAPCGKKLRQYPDVVKYLARNGICDITRDHFSFSGKIKVGDFYEAREGPEGLQWVPLQDEEIPPRILAMEGRRGRPPNPDQIQSGGVGAQAGGSSGESSQGSKQRRKGRPPNVGGADFPSASDAKLLRKLEAQEIARQAAQIKLMRKLEKQAMARAAKEARKQQALVAAEEKKRQKEQMKIMKQQEKIKRIQQIRVEKELRAQQILEAKRKKREDAANAKILEAEKRIKEKEMRRQQAIILKHQELERLRLDMERERRRQHMMLMKAVEARKKAEEKERLKQEKRDEKRLNKERKLQLRRLEMEMAKQLKKPNEDMSLADHKPLPEFCRIPGLLLPGGTFAECLMVLQFLRCFGPVLGLDGAGCGAEVPGLGMLQEGLLNATGPATQRLLDLLVRMLAAAINDPGLPPGHRAKTALGEQLSSVGINRDNVSEVLQIFLEAHCSPLHTGLTLLAHSLRTKPFQAHSPAQKASILAFLVNELACSKSVVSEIDKTIDHMTNLRRDKWVIEGKLRKLRSLHAKRTGKRDCSLGGEETPSLGTPIAGGARKRKTADSDEDDDEEEDSEDQGVDDDDDDEDVGKKMKKGDICDDEDEMDQAASVEDLEKQIEKLSKQQVQVRRRLFESSGSLRSMMFGQDRFKRRYWVLPQCGGVFVEAMESGEGAAELEKERERGRNAPPIKVKEEPMDDEEEEPMEEGKPALGSSPEIKEERQTPPTPEAPSDSLNLFLQKPGSFSKLSKLLEVAKMSPERSGSGSRSVSPPHSHSHGGSPTTCAASASAGSPDQTPTTFPSSPLGTCAAPPTTLMDVKPDLGPSPSIVPGGLYSNGPGKAHAHAIYPQPSQSQQPLLPNDQLLRVLTEKSGHWFSLLPRSPCDVSSVTSSPTPPPPATEGALCASSALISTSPTQTVAAGVPGPKSPPSLSSIPLALGSTSTSMASPRGCNPGFPSSSSSAINNFPLSPLQVKPGMSVMGMPYCSWPGGVASPSLHYATAGTGTTTGTSPLPSAMGLGYLSAGAEGNGNGNPFLTPSAATSKSASPAPHSEKLQSTTSPSTMDGARPQDYPAPQPIPEDMLRGWWRVGEQEELRSLVKALHSRGVREKALQKQLQKHMDYISQSCARHREVCAINVCALEERQLSEETLASWCVEEQAMEVDIAALQQVEELERRVTSASLQVKGWLCPVPQSEREDLVYHEHKPQAKLSPTGTKTCGEDRPDGVGVVGVVGGIVRRPNNPLDIAVARLGELERHLERRYLKSPLSTTIQIRLGNVGTVTVPAPAPAPSCSADGDGGQEDVAPGMKVWRKALAEVRSAAQLALCIQQLQKSIAWERSIMKVFCQICRKGDNEELLLLCDGCDRGCHTYCHRPKITTIPDGDWFCPVCITKASGPSPKSKKQPSRTTPGSGPAPSPVTGNGGGSSGGCGNGGGGAGGGGGGRKTTEVKKRKPSLTCEGSEDETGSNVGGTGGGTPKKAPKETKRRKVGVEGSPVGASPKQEGSSSAKKGKIAPPASATTPTPATPTPPVVQDNSRDLILCRLLLTELEGHPDAWPFLSPVNIKAVPGYKKVIKTPMDLSTIRDKLANNLYLNLETFIIDVNLIFDNCETFNEDNSDIGRAGHNMRQFFEKRWPDLLRQTN